MPLRGSNSCPCLLVFSKNALPPLLEAILPESLREKIKQPPDEYLIGILEEAVKQSC